MSGKPTVGKKTGVTNEISTTEGEVFCPDQLLHRCLGKIELAQRVLDRFLSNVDQDVEDLVGAVRGKDTCQLARTAHRMKGSAASIAAHRLQGLMSELERAGRTNVAGDIDDMLKLVQGEMESLKEVLVEWRGGEARTMETVGSCSSRLSPQKDAGYSTSW